MVRGGGKVLALPPPEEMVNPTRGRGRVLPLPLRPGKERRFFPGAWKSARQCPVKTATKGPKGQKMIKRKKI